MKISVIGTGYVGLVTGTCLAHVGHQVTCIDIDVEKVAKMKRGTIPIYEPGLEEVFQEAMTSKNLAVTTDLESGIKDSLVIFLALPTPQGADGSADLSAVTLVAKELGPILKDYTVIVNKSTVPVGTGEQVTASIAEASKHAFDVVSNPEFLREGLAVKDFMHPDRIVIGTDSQRAEKIMRDLYDPIVDNDNQIVVMDRRSSEMTKYAANSFLAMKVSFMNEIANLCELVGGNVDSVRKGIGPDKRIGEKFLYAGIGYGGSCFPKDVQALQRTSEAYGYDFRMLDSIIQVNTAQKRRLIDKVIDRYSKDAVKGMHFAIWGLAFKPNTDDIRETPAYDVIDGLLKLGASISAYDPHAIPNMKKHRKPSYNLTYAKDALAALKDASALLIVTEWDEFKDPDFRAVAATMDEPVIFDGRNIYDPKTVASHGIEYQSIGRIS